MAEMDALTKYRLILDQEELRLVGLALAGKLTRGKDQRAALELNLKLLGRRAQLTNELKDIHDGAWKKALEEAKFSDATEEQRTQEADDGG